MPRILLCQLGPGGYRLSTGKERALRWVRDAVSRQKFAREKAPESLPVCLIRHSSLICRRWGNGGGMCQFTNLIHWMVLHTP